jgi:23S rRNA (adenine2503-C2)-methyltransferase
MAFADPAFFMAERLPIKGLTLDEMRVRLHAMGEPSFRAGQLLQWIFVRRANAFAQMTDLPAALRVRIE